MPDLIDDEEFERLVGEYTHDTAFVEAVKRVMVEANGLPSALCVDEKIIAELDREWNRMDPTNAFGLYESLKAENPKVWVSPEVSLRMFRSVEIVARQAYNRATQ